MRKYWAFYSLGIQNTLAYRGPIFFWLAGNIISMVVMIAVWLSVDSDGVMGSYSKNELITYYIIAFGLEWFVNWYPFNWIREEIKNGDIVGTALLKPLSYFGKAFAAEASWHSITVFLGLGITLIFTLAFQQFFIPIVNISQIPILIIAILLAAFLTFSFSICLGLLTFWVLETEMLFDLYWAILALLGGQLLPITFLPPVVQKISELLPFRYMFSFPLEIYFGKATHQGIFSGLLAQVFWIFILVTLYKFLWTKGTRKYEAWGN